MEAHTKATMGHYEQMVSTCNGGETPQAYQDELSCPRLRLNSLQGPCFLEPLHAPEVPLTDSERIHEPAGAFQGT